MRPGFLSVFGQVFRSDCYLVQRIATSLAYPSTLRGLAVRRVKINMNLFSGYGALFILHAYNNPLVFVPTWDVYLSQAYRLVAIDAFREQIYFIC